MYNWEHNIVVVFKYVRNNVPIFNLILMLNYLKLFVKIYFIVFFL